jgi:hypothetical protein
VGFPIRKSADQSFFAAPRGLSQRSTSFIASQRQGIHQMPLRHLIALIINAHAPRRCSARSLHFLQKDTDLERPVCFTRSIQRHCGQATPTLPSPKLARRRTHGDCAHPVTHVTWSAWINLLFTMSDNTRAAAEASDVRIHFSQRTSEIYHPGLRAVWWSQTGSNRRPPACKAGALPTELWPRASRQRTFAVRRSACNRSGLAAKVGGPGKT